MVSARDPINTPEPPRFNVRVELERVTGHGQNREMRDEARLSLTADTALAAVNKAIDLLYVLRSDYVTGTTNTDRAV